MTAYATGKLPSADTAHARTGLDPKAVLLTAGLAGPVELAAAELRDVSRSHQVTLAELPDGTAFVVKQISARTRDCGRSLDAELYAYRLATWQTGLSAVLPTPLHLDERHQVLVLPAAGAEQLYVWQLGQPGFPGPRLAAQLGEILAKLHASTTDVPLLTEASCGVLQLPDIPRRDWHIGDDSPAAMAAARTAVDDPPLAAALRHAASLLHPECLVHGDVKWDNAVIDAGPPARVRLFDWELSGRGDPAWDVACALADTSFFSVRSPGSTVRPGLATGWLSPSMRALLAAYAECRRDQPGTGQAIDAVLADLAERVLFCWIGRGVHLAVECAAATEDAGHPAVTDLLASTRQLAQACPEVLPLVRSAVARSR
jgi:aminoglycoside phosphotransferase (APT) family kinase protein